MKYYSITKNHRLPGAFKSRTYTRTDFYIRSEDIPESDRQIAVEHEFDSVLFPLPPFQQFRQEWKFDGTITNTLVNAYTDEKIVLA